MQHRNNFVRLGQYAAIVGVALILMIVGVVVQQSRPAAAAGCTTTLTDYSLPGWPNAYYHDPAFFDGKCVDGGRPFPNTGTPYSPDGNVDSVGYVIPRTYKSADYASEALSYVGTKTEFYDKLRYHYYDRVDASKGQLGYWAKDGAAFVVFSLIGEDPPANRNLTDANWAEFKRRLDNPNLVMSLVTNKAMSPNSGAVFDTAGRLDFAHFYDEMGNYGPALVFYINGIEVASIERKCANLLGYVELPAAPQWTTSADSKVGVGRSPNVDSWPDAKPTQLVTWHHTVSASGGASPAMGFAINKTGFNGADVWGTGLPANHNQPVGTIPSIASGGTYRIGYEANRPEYSEYRVLPSDGGRTLCQYISWGPYNYTRLPGDAWASSEPACVDVPFNYNLVPSVSGPGGFGTVGGSIDVNPRINNALAVNPSITTDSPPVDWQLTRIEVAPGESIPKTQEQNGTVPCTHYANDCSVRSSGNRTFPAGAITFNALTNEPIPVDAPVGTQICYALSVRPYSQGSAMNWRHSPATCIKVSKQPKVQIWGHDVRTRGNIEAWSTKTNSGGSEKLFGSWVEYGAFSALDNSGFASGSGLNTGNTATDSTDPGNVWNKLTFANIDEDDNTAYGRFTLPSELPTITGQFLGTPSGDPINGNLGSLASGRYVVTGEFTINESTVGQAGSVGKSIIVVASDTVTIDGNITYEGAGGSDTFTDIRQIPQVVIIAPTINIKGNVSQIDAWLLTTTPNGAINTCSDVDVDDALRAGVCGTVLTINGPVVTPNLHLRRTGGSETVATAGDPAEIFNLRPDAYVWAYGRSSQSGKAQTVYSVELPPRF